MIIDSGFYKSNNRHQKTTVRPQKPELMYFSGKLEQPRMPEELKPFYQQKMVRNPGFWKSSAYILGGSTAIIGSVALTAFVFPPALPLIGLLAGFGITWYTVGKTLPQWEKNNLTMTIEQAKKDALFNKELAKYERQLKWETIKNKILSFFGTSK
jgi:hypothetical protein